MVFVTTPAAQAVVVYGCVCMSTRHRTYRAVLLQNLFITDPPPPLEVEVDYISQELPCPFFFFAHLVYLVRYFLGSFSFSFSLSRCDPDNRVTHQAGSSLPSPLRYAPSFFLREHFSPFLPSSTRIELLPFVTLPRSCRTKNT